jgi:putative transposase
MPLKTNTGILSTETFYHIYNRGINGEPLFKEHKNYAFFLKKFAHFVSPIADTYAYCLLSNHFHFLIKTKSRDSILEKKPPQEKNTVKGNDKPAEWYISNQFASFFRSYALSINKGYGRTGGLFEEPFRRAEIVSNKHLTNAVAYIHYNPQLHGFVNDFRKYKHSSYNGLLSNLPSLLMRTEIMEWFGDKENFIAYHDQNISLAKNSEEW